MTGSMKPRYAHDCTACAFVGQLPQHDVYACPQHGFPTIVCREGDEPEHYRSGSHLLGLLPAEMQDRAVEAVPELALFGCSKPQSESDLGSK